ncbi:MAG: sulfatase [Planctomycetota bacterium]
MSAQPRAGLLVALAVLAACHEARIPAARREQPRPNVLLITLDTTRADRLGCYGGAKPLTPSLDELAAQGCVFLDATAQASVTPVSHASIMTGRYPYHHRLRVLHGLRANRLPDDETTLAEILERRGYDTAAFVSAFPVTERFGLDQGFAHFDADFPRQATAVSRRGVVSTSESQRRADATTGAALRWLERASSPWLLWVHYFDPHDLVLMPPPEFLLAFTIDHSDPRQMLRDLYDAEVAYMDQEIGRLLDRLRTCEQYDRTLVVAVADHGEGLGEHQWWTHGLLYQEQLHVPLIIRAPGAPAGQRVRTLVRTIDIVPTILAQLALESPARMDGIDLSGLLDASGHAPELTAYSDSLDAIHAQHTDAILDQKQEPLFSLRDGRFKLIVHQGAAARTERFDLELDPHETRDLGAAAGLVPDLGRELAAHMASAPWHADDLPMSAEDLEQLEAIGYGK